jgi:signal transduction histidine kinase
MRRRLTGLAVLASVLAVLLFAVPLAVAVARYLASDERSELQRLAATAAASVHGELTPAALSANPALHGEQAITMYGPTGTRLFGSGPLIGGDPVTSALSGQAETSTAHGQLTASAAISDGDAIIAAVTVSTPASDLNRRIALAWTEMAIAASIVIALTAAAARLYSRRLSTPLEQLADTAHRLGNGQRDSEVRGSSIAEVDTVARALHTSAEKLHAAHDRERRFTTDASHQLRTPLAALRMELESALLNDRVDAREAISRALTATDHLQDTVEALLRLARDRPSPAVAVLSEAFTQFRIRWSGPLAATNRPLRIELDPHTADTVSISKAALDEILDVLLDNAERHGTGAVTVTARALPGAVAIDVSNPGPAITTPADRLFQRHNPDAHGHGIGLALARSLAEAEGARLTLSSTNPPTFSLLIPASPEI